MHCLILSRLPGSSACDPGHIAIVFRRYTVFRIAGFRKRKHETAGFSSCSDGTRSNGSESHGSCSNGSLPAFSGCTRKVGLILRRGSLHPITQDPLLRVEGLSKVFRSGEDKLVLFENLSFQVQKGTMLA